MMLRRKSLVRILLQARADYGGGLDEVVAWDEDYSQFNSIYVHSSNESNHLTVKKRGEIRGVLCTHTTFEITEYALRRSRSRLELTWNLLYLRNF